MRSARLLVLASAAVLAFAAGAYVLSPGAPAGAAPTAVHTINGTWTCCGAGGAGAQDWVISDNGGEGLSPGGGEFATLQVSYNWPNVSIETIYVGSTYTATFIGTIIDNATVMTGTWTSDTNQSGTWTATLGSRAPPPTTESINGTWLCTWAGSPNPQTWVIEDNNGQADSGGTQFATMSITYTWPTAVIVVTYITGGYRAQFDATISQNNTFMSGGWTGSLADPATVSGDWTASLEGTSPPPPTRTDPHGVTPAPIARSIGTPGEVFHSVPHDLATAAITVGAILFITFPATIFNQTFSSNYDEILFIIGGWRRRARKVVGRADSPPRTHPDAAAPVESDAGATPTPESAPAPGRTTAVWFGAVLVVGALLGRLLNPSFGLNGTSAANIAATLFAFAFGATISWFVSHRFRLHHHYGTHTYLRALPLGLGVAALCVLVSRVSNFQPGYLYGIVVSFGFIETLEDRHNAHLTAISTISTLSVALSAWFLWIPVNHLALDHASVFPLAVLDDVLGSIFIGGLVGTVISLLPITLMPGRTVLSWRRDAWVALMFLALFLLVGVELRPASGPTHTGAAAWVTVVVLFAIFGGGTVAMRQYFAHRTPQSPAAIAAAAAKAAATVSATTAPLADEESSTADATEHPQS